MNSLRFMKARPWMAHYEGEGTGTGDGQGAGGNPPAGDPPKTFNQDQVNAFLKKEKETWQRKAETDRQQLMKQLTDIQNNANTSAEAKAALETQLEELRQQNMTAEERAGIALKKAQKEYDEKYGKVEGEAKRWKSQHDELMVGYDISTVFSGDDIVQGSGPLIESYLKPRTKLVEVIDPETNKGTGRYKTAVRLTVKDKNDKPIEMDLSMAEARKAMKEDVENFGFIFKSSAAGGLGAGTGTPGKKPNVANMSPEQYAEARKKDPKSLGLA